MKRRAREALAGCGGRCPHAQELAADLEASGEALDREAQRNRALEAQLEAARAELAHLRALASCRTGLTP